MTLPALCAELRSPRAFALYRLLVSRGRQRPAPLHAAYGCGDIEKAWDLTPEFDPAALGIDPRLHHALSWAHARYADMIGLSGGAFIAYQDEEQRAYAELFGGPGVYSLDDAVAFMASACQLPATQADLWVCRYRINVVRSGFIEAEDPAPDWALRRFRKSSKL